MSYKSHSKTGGHRPPLQKTSTPAFEFVDFDDEIVDVVFFNDDRRNELLLCFRYHGAIAIQEFVNENDRLVTEFVRLLHDGGVNGAFFNPGERLIILVEANDLNLAHLSRILDRIENCRTVVSPQTHE